MKNVIQRMIVAGAVMLLGGVALQAMNDSYITPRKHQQRYRAPEIGIAVGSHVNKTTKRLFKYIESGKVCDIRIYLNEGLEKPRSNINWQATNMYGKTLEMAAAASKDDGVIEAVTALSKLCKQDSL